MNSGTGKQDSMSDSLDVNFKDKSDLTLYFLKIYVFLILEKEEGREREKHQCERETSIPCLPYMSQLWIKPTT